MLRKESNRIFFVPGTWDQATYIRLSIDRGFVGVPGMGMNFLNLADLHFLHHSRWEVVRGGRRQSVDVKRIKTREKEWRRNLY